MKLNRATAVLFYIAALSIQIGLLLADDSSSEENGGGRRQQQTQYCRKIKRRCPMDLLQSGRVCGDDGRTYKNTCQLQRTSCKIARTINVSFRGTCKEREQEAGGRSGTGMSKQCQRVIRRCPKQYLNGPCCGTNDVTYPNECELHRYRCRNGIGLRKLRVKHQGACRIKVPTQPPITQAPPAPSTTLDPCHRHCGNDPRSTFVCGSDGVTYLSACHLEKIACSSGKTITVVHTGLCHPTEKPEPRPPTKPHYPAEPPTKPHVPAGPHSPAGPKVEKTTVIPTTGAGEPPPTARPVTPEKRVFPTTKVATPGPATVKPKCLIDGIQTRVQCDDGGVPPDTPQCPSNCEVTIDTKPVCGSDGKTYKTKCHLHREACLANNVALTVDYEGECVESVPGERDCDFCPGTMYAPCCGTDGISYYNECELRKYACYINDLTLMVAHEGVCREIAPPPPENPDCPSRCPLMIDPVCGTNGKTYNSICLLKSAACELMDPTLTVAYIGDCVVPTTPDPCVRDCPTSYDPVCGSDWTTYLNECFFRIAACRDPNLLKIHSGTCRMTIRSQLH